jgi:hypothetical protein
MTPWSIPAPSISTDRDEDGNATGNGRNQTDDSAPEPGAVYPY